MSENIMYMVTYFCSNNGKYKYELHQMEAMNRKLERLNKNKQVFK